MTRAERRQAREAEEAGGLAPSAAAPSPPPGRPVPPRAAAGAAAWGARDDEEAGTASERIASAADFRDDVPEQRTEPADQAGLRPATGPRFTPGPTG